MAGLIKNIKQAVSRSIFKDTFNRDIVTLVLISIIVGSVLASTVSLSANAYFSKTLADLVGDYGEYDVIINVREEMKSDAAIQIKKIIQDNFPGARFKEGPTLTGKSNFFIGLPEEYKTKQIYEQLDEIFGSIPGGAGVSVATEPRLMIRGVPEGAKAMIVEKISEMDGVRFAFRDGGSIGVILVSLEKTNSVSSQIKDLLKQYQVIEIAFPVGSEPSNPIHTGEAIAEDMKAQLNTSYAQNVSIDGKNDDMTYMISTMMELKRFLSAYATQVVVRPAVPGSLAKGDTVVFQGTAVNPLAIGAAPASVNTLVEINSFNADGSANGVIKQGDGKKTGNGSAVQGYRLIGGVIGEQAVTATYRNPREELSVALAETTKLVGEVPGFAQDTKKLSGIALNALDNYQTSLNTIDQTLSSVQEAGNTVQSATQGLANINTSLLQSQLDNSAQSMGTVINTLQVFKLVNGDVGSTIDSLNSNRQSLYTLKNNLSALDSVAANARQAKTTIDNIVANGNTAIGALRSFDAAGAKLSLVDTTNRLGKLEQLNVPLITAQLQYLAAAVPSLKDDEIYKSVKLLDQFIAGQVIPGQRIQILTDGNVSTDNVAAIVHKEVGHNNVALYSTALGVIEPNARGELYQVLNEVRAILSGMTAIIVTILLLALDHTAIMAVIRRRRLAVKFKTSGWRSLLSRPVITFTAPERQYGMVIGAILLTAMFILARGGIPYLPWIGVPLLGALLGLIAANYAEKISPVSTDEIMAGQSLGLSFDEIMREIVIPSARPGLMQKLNNRKVKFK